MALTDIRRDQPVAHHLPADNPLDPNASLLPVSSHNENLSPPEAWQLAPTTLQELQGMGGSQLTRPGMMPPTGQHDILKAFEDVETQPTGSFSREDADVETPPMTEDEVWTVMEMEEFEALQRDMAKSGSSHGALPFLRDPPANGLSHGQLPRLDPVSHRQALQRPTSRPHNSPASIGLASALWYLRLVNDQNEHQPYFQRSPHPSITSKSDTGNVDKMSGQVVKDPFTLRFHVDPGRESKHPTITTGALSTFCLVSSSCLCFGGERDPAKAEGLKTVNNVVEDYEGIVIYETARFDMLWTSCYRVLS